MSEGGLDFERLAQPGIQRLRAYDPGHDIVALRARFATASPSLLEMGSNESAYGPSDKALDAIATQLESLHRYPDPLGGALRGGLASTLHLRTDQVLLGNGSHELLMMLSQVFAGPDAGVVASEFGFAVYAIAAQAAAAPLHRAPALGLDSRMPRGHDLLAIGAAIDASTRLVYLANPNNPTGTWFPTSELDAFLAGVRSDVLVVVDEAYLEFVVDPALGSAIGLLDRYPNLVVTRTFSKAYGLAGLRVGYACAHAGLIAVLERVRESFNVNAVGLAACMAAIGDQAHVERVRIANAAARDLLAAALRTLGLAVAPSQTNFLLVDFGRDVAAIERGLLASGIVLRPMGTYGLPNCLRVTVGLQPDNERLVQTLEAFIHAA